MASAAAVDAKIGTADKLVQIVIEYLIAHRFDTTELHLKMLECFRANNIEIFINNKPLEVLKYAHLLFDFIHNVQTRGKMQETATHVSSVLYNYDDDDYDADGNLKSKAVGKPLTFVATLPQ